MDPSPNYKYIKKMVLVCLVVGAILLVIYLIKQVATNTSGDICNDITRCTPEKFTDYCFSASTSRTAVEECDLYCEELAQELRDNPETNLWCSYEYCVSTGYVDYHLCGCETPITSITTQNIVYIKHKETGLYLSLETIPYDTRPTEDYYTYIGTLKLTVNEISPNAGLICHGSLNPRALGGYFLQSNKYLRYGLNFSNTLNMKAEQDPYFYEMNQSNSYKSTDIKLFESNGNYRISIVRPDTNDSLFLYVENGDLSATPNCRDFNIDWVIETTDIPVPFMKPVNPNNLGPRLRFVVKCEDPNTYFLDVKQKSGIDALHLLEYTNNTSDKEIRDGQYYWASNKAETTYKGSWMKTTYKLIFIDTASYYAGSNYSITNSDSLVAFQESGKECECKPCNPLSDPNNPDIDCRYCYESDPLLGCLKYRYHSCEKDPRTFENICVEDPDEDICYECKYDIYEPYTFGIVFSQENLTVRIYLDNFPVFNDNRTKINITTLYPTLVNNYFYHKDTNGSSIDYYIQQATEYDPLTINCS